jgi:hypothetical protein
MRFRLLPAVLLFLGSSVPVAAATIVRGPYLQRTSATAAVLRWRTDVATDTWSGWGEVAGVYDQTASSSALVTEHVVAIAGLAATTRPSSARPR